MRPSVYPELFLAPEIRSTAVVSWPTYSTSERTITVSQQELLPDKCFLLMLYFTVR